MYNREAMEKGAQLLNEFGQVATLRSNFESTWQSIAETVFPSSSGTFNSRNPYYNQGARKQELMFDSTASIALGRFAAIIDSLITPRNSTWHRLTTNNPYLNKNREVKLWYEEATRLLFKYRYAPKANFASQNHRNYRGLGAFGTGAMFVDELKGGGLRYRAVPLGEIFIRENHQGLVDTVFRYFPLSVRQAVQKFGDATPECVRKKLANSPDADVMFLHVVKPREDLDPTRLDYKGMPFASFYVCVENKEMISEGGYNTFPYAISRYFQGDGNVYGDSPALECFPAIRTLNEQKKTVLKQGHRTVDPVLLAHDDGVLDSFSMRPGALNFGGVSADGRPLVHALPVGNIAIGKELMDDERKDINDAFLVNLFQILTETPTMTATEVMERTREKGILIAPTIGRQNDEYLGPMIERELDQLASQGLLPPMPEILKEARGEYDIEYDSPLSRAARAEEASGLMRTVETALQIVNVTQDPEPLDHFEWDVIIPELSDINAVPERWRRDMKKIEAIRQGRSEAKQQQDEVNAAPGAAAMVKAAAVAKKA